MSKTQIKYVSRFPYTKIIHTDTRKRYDTRMQINTRVLL
uniref:Uncharacterized protein n=1 Tax=Anguilla anguilla TaxID=7936 RepID=A0A0E9V734_ANGAN